MVDWNKIIRQLMMNMEMIEIKKGGKYTVISNSGTEEPMRTEGEFVGYTILGEEGALCFRIVDENKSFLRLIPVGGLIAIEFSEDDLLKPKQQKDEGERTNYIS